MVGAVIGWDQLGEEPLVKGFGHVLLELLYIQQTCLTVSYTNLKLREKIHVVDINLKSPSYLLLQCCLTKSNNHETLNFHASGVAV